ncbi:hypothetical protein OC845_006781, partial [Tilletia horrida]
TSSLAKVNPAPPAQASSRTPLSSAHPDAGDSRSIPGSEASEANQARGRSTALPQPDRAGLTQRGNPNRGDPVRDRPHHFQTEMQANLDTLRNKLDEVDRVQQSTEYEQSLPPQKAARLKEEERRLSLSHNACDQAWSDLRSISSGASIEGPSHEFALLLDRLASFYCEISINLSDYSLHTMNALLSALTISKQSIQELDRISRVRWSGEHFSNFETLCDSYLNILDRFVSMHNDIFPFHDGHSELLRVKIGISDDAFKTIRANWARLVLSHGVKISQGYLALKSQLSSTYLNLRRGRLAGYASTLHLMLQETQTDQAVPLRDWMNELFEGLPVSPNGLSWIPACAKTCAQLAFLHEEEGRSEESDRRFEQSAVYFQALTPAAQILWARVGLPVLSQACVIQARNDTPEALNTAKETLHLALIALQIVPEIPNVLLKQLGVLTVVKNLLEPMSREQAIEETGVIYTMHQDHHGPALHYSAYLHYKYVRSGTTTSGDEEDYNQKCIDAFKALFRTTIQELDQSTAEIFYTGMLEDLFAHLDTVDEGPELGTTIVELFEELPESKRKRLHRSFACALQKLADLYERTQARQKLEQNGEDGAALDDDAVKVLVQGFRSRAAMLSLFQ